MSGLTLSSLLADPSRHWVPQSNTGMLPRSNSTTECDRCDCCPYGYHIHLDFVRYCETLALVPPSSPTPSELRRKRRRKQRQSMEMLLGLLPPLPQTPASRESYTTTVSSAPSVPASPVTPSSTTYSSYEDLAKDRALEEAVKDFETTLEKSYRKHYSNQISPSPIRLQLTQIKNSAPKPSPKVDSEPLSKVDSENPEVGNEEDMQSTTALQNIRRHMAYSLRRVRELEEQIKVIPKLQMQITALKEEKKKLETEMQEKDTQTSSVKMITPTRVNLVSLNSLSTKMRSTSFSEQRSIKITRNAEAQCSIITRNVGTATQSTRCRTLGVGNDSIKAIPNITYSSAMQTELSMQDVLSCLEAELQMESLRQKLINDKPIMKTVGLQSDILTKNVGCQVNPSMKSIGINVFVKPITTEVTVEAKCEYKNASCTANIVQKCIRCEEQRKLDEPKMNGYGNSVSLSLLSIIKDKPIDAKSSHNSKVTKHIGVQVVPITESKHIQFYPQCETKGTQQSITTYSRSQQYDSVGITKCTDTDNLICIKDQTTNTLRPQLVDASCGENIKPHIMISCADNYCDTCKEHIKTLAKGFSTSDISRIPRPTATLTTSKCRNIRDPSPIGKRGAIYLSSLEPSKSFIKEDGIKPQPSETNKFETKQSQVQTTENIAQVQSTPIIPRQKSEPSKEMKAAIKVLNDSGKKSPKGFGSSYLRNVNTVIQKEWFMISSESESNPNIVLDYMDYFKSISDELLQYVVNITDATGNTAMHYAVSHGNFDMVSVLIDSGVCSINQANSAGYTSVMLVSLAELTSPNHKAIVKRLFQLADVNIPAKQHGQTALMLAVSHGRYEMVNMLLETGADLNIQDEDGSTALMCAAEHGYANIVKLFLSQPECDSSIVDVDGSNALKIALEAGHKDIGVMLYAHERKSRTSSPHGSLRSHRHSSSVPSSPVSPRRNIKNHKA